jgi:hypothetical protein
MINHCDRHIILLETDRSITVIYHAMSDYCISITKKSDRSITDLSCYDSDYCISITKKTDYSSQRHSMIHHCDRPITLPSDTDTVQSET